MLSTTILITILITLITAYLITRYRAFRAHVNRIPGPKVERSLLLGNLDLFKPQGRQELAQGKEGFVRKFHARFSALFERYRSEGVFRLWMGPLNAIYVLTNAAAVEKLLSSHVNVNKGEEYHFISPLLGDGLLMSEASVWRHRRKLLVTGFHVKILQDFLPIFNVHTEKLLRKVDAQFSDGNSANHHHQQKSSVIIKDMRTLYEDLTLDIVKETSFGLDEKTDMTTNEPYRNALKEVFFGISDRIRTPLHWIDAIYKLTDKGRKFKSSIDLITGYAEEVIKKRRRLFEKTDDSNGDDHHQKTDNHELNNNNNNNDSGIEEEGNNTSNSSKNKNRQIIIDILLQAAAAAAAKDSKKASNLHLTDHAIKAEVNTFIVGGHDTTATALTFSTMLIAAHPEVQAKVLAELEEVFSAEAEAVEEDGDNEEEANFEITFDHLRRLRYLEQTVKEALRLWPSVQVVGRKLDEALHLENGVTIEAGSTCYVAPAFLHQDPAYFPEPERFNPDRFAEKLSSSYAYVPFMAGPRACIGQRYALLELKYVLARLLWRYQVKTVTRPEEVTPGISIVLKPMGLISVAFERRRRR